MVCNCECVSSVQVSAAYSNTIQSFTGVSLSIHAKIPLKNWKCTGDFLNMPLKFSLEQLVQRNSSF